MHDTLHSNTSEARTIRSSACTIHYTPTLQRHTQYGRQHARYITLQHFRDTHNMVVSMHDTLHSNTSETRIIRSSACTIHYTPTLQRHAQYSRQHARYITLQHFSGMHNTVVSMHDTLHSNTSETHTIWSSACTIHYTPTLQRHAQYGRQHARYITLQYFRGTHNTVVSMHDRLHSNTSEARTIRSSACTIHYTPTLQRHTQYGRQHARYITLQHFRDTNNTVVSMHDTLHSNTSETLTIRSSACTIHYTPTLQRLAQYGRQHA